MASSTSPYSSALPAGPSSSAAAPRPPQNASFGAAVCRTLCCAARPADEERLSLERQRWKEKWGNVVGFVRQIASGRGQRRKSPRDLLFEALLSLYGHEDIDEAIRSLYEIWEIAPHVVTHFAPQLVNFLLHGRMPGAERLEIFLLDKCERSMHFSHRVFFFLQAYAPMVPYTSELCGAIQNKGGVLSSFGGRSLLIRAVQVQGGLAATRMAKQAFFAQQNHQALASGAPSAGLALGRVAVGREVAAAGAAPSSSSSSAAAAAPRVKGGKKSGGGASSSADHHHHHHHHHHLPPADHAHDQSGLEERAAVALVAYTPWALHRAIPSEPLPPRAIDLLLLPPEPPTTTAGSGAGASAGAGGSSKGNKRPSQEPLTGSGGGGGTGGRGTVLLVTETGAPYSSSAAASSSTSPAVASGFVNVSLSPAGSGDATARPPALAVGSSGAGAGGEGEDSSASDVGLNTPLAQRIKQNLATQAGPAPLPHPHPPGLHTTATATATSNASDATVVVAPNPLHKSNSGANINGGTTSRARSRSGSVAAAMTAAPPATVDGSGAVSIAVTNPMGSGGGAGSTALQPIQHKPELIREPSTSSVPVVGGSSAFCGSAASAIGCAGGPGGSGSGDGSILSGTSFGGLASSSRGGAGAGGDGVGGSSSVEQSILAVTKPPVGGVGESHDGFASAFNDTPAICSELTRIGYQLIPAPVEQRNALLRLALQAVAARFLPSYSAYAPVGNPFNRLVAIHPDHSFCFRTKERVPYMVVLEVVDYSNGSGGPLDEIDEDADDEQIERAKRLRQARLHEEQMAAQAAAAAAKEAKKRGKRPQQQQQIAMAGGTTALAGSADEESGSGTDADDAEGGGRGGRRGRSSTLGGGAADAAEKVAAAVSEGVRSAAEMVSGGAHAISNYFSRQFAEVSQRRLNARRQQQHDAEGGGGTTERGRDRASRNSTNRKGRSGSFDANSGGLGVGSLASELRAESANPDARRANIRKARATYAPGSAVAPPSLPPSLALGAAGIDKTPSSSSSHSLLTGTSQQALLASSGLEMSPPAKSRSGTGLAHHGSASFSGVIGTTAGLADYGSTDASGAGARGRSLSAQSDTLDVDHHHHHHLHASATHSHSHSLSAGSASNSWRNLGGSASDTMVEKEKRERSKRGLLSNAASAVSAERIGASLSKGKAAVQDAIAAVVNSASGTSGAGSATASLRKPLIAADDGLGPAGGSDDDESRERHGGGAHARRGRGGSNSSAIGTIGTALASSSDGDGDDGDDDAATGDETLRLSALGQWGGAGSMLALSSVAAAAPPSPPASSEFAIASPSRPAGSSPHAIAAGAGGLHESGSSSSLFSPVVGDVVDDEQAPPSVAVVNGARAPGLASIGGGGLQTTASAASSVTAPRAFGGQQPMSAASSNSSNNGLLSPSGFSLNSPGATIGPASVGLATPAPTPASSHPHPHPHTHHSHGHGLAREALTADADLDRELRDLPADMLALVHGKAVDPDAPDDSMAAASSHTALVTSASGASAANASAGGGAATATTGDGASAASAGAGGQQQRSVVANAFAAVGSGALVNPEAGAAAAADGSSVSSEGAGSASSVGGANARTAPTIVFAERWREKEARIAATSPYSHLPGWRLMPVIVKAHDDLRQEQFAGQLMQQFFRIFRAASVPVWMRPYDILATQADGGMLACVPDTISVDSLKRGDPHFTTLDDWFERHFNWGPRGGERVAAAKMNFVRSMAAYSIVCYILAIKDRHNGNILIDRKGHVIHIDFGFLFTNSPGGNINFEAAPFKLTQEFVQVMGGPRSSLFNTFRKLCVQAFLAARKYRERILLLVEMMLSGNADLKCFIGGPKAVMSGLHARFHEDKSDRQCAKIVNDLIDASNDALRTRLYDAFQRWSQGVR